MKTSTIHEAKTHLSRLSRPPIASDPGALMRLHLPALFVLDGAGRMLSVNVPGGAAAPRFFLGRTVAGAVWAVRHDVDPVVADRLAELARSEPCGLPEGPVPDEDTSYLGLLSRSEPVSRVWSGPAYHFPGELARVRQIVNITSSNASVLTRWLPNWLPDVSPEVPLTAFLEDGAAVSVCASVRITSAAHEAGVRDLGVIPLYSTSWENVASQSVAARLGLIHYGSTLHVT